MPFPVVSALLVVEIFNDLTMGRRQMEVSLELPLFGR
jgi:hypothetical protein